jgi:hypothetical protein
MAEPINISENSEIPEIPERLKRINALLEDYKSKIIDDTTLDNQSPEQSHSRLREELSRKGSLLIRFFKYSEKNPEIQDIIESIEPLLSPWSPELRPIAAHSTTLIFLDYPLTLSIEHANRLNKI